jgi:ribonucleoside-triphosphate reductase
VRCPFCGSEELKVIDKRESGDLSVTRRRRACNSCSKRFTTYERVEDQGITVLKKNGEKELFDPEKIKKGVEKAAEKTSINPEKMEAIVSEVEQEIRSMNQSEVKSSKIGQLVMKKLKKNDEVAYLRFASVYRSFSDIESFKKELNKLEKKEGVSVMKKNNNVTKIIKRDGKLVSFNKEKVVKAIFAAAQSIGGKDRKLSEELAEDVVQILNERYNGKNKIPNVEEVQDIVEKVLIENGHAQTAKAYILYRQQHKVMRETKDVMINAKNTISSYLDQLDWKVKENSNEQFSFSGLLLYVSGKVIKNYVLNEIYTPAIAEAHNKGFMHIHDLSHGCIGYCSGWSLKNLLLKGFGGIKGKADCKPAKHMGTVVHQMINFIGCLQMEFAGAQAFSSVDTLLAPFVREDGLKYKEVKQCMQQLVFSLNIPSRWGSQYPFSNLTFDWVVPEDYKKEKAIVGGKRMDYTYSDLQKEMDMINKAFLEIMLEGDANGRIFSFPIPTYNLTRDFNWDSENAELLFDVTAKYGTPYFQNYIGSNLDPKSIRAMCCRLNLNQLELMNRPGSMWGPGDNTGSIGVATINLNRLAYLAKDKEEFFDLIKKYMILAKDSLEIKRKIISKNLENGLMPYTKIYLGTFRNHFSTIGLCGMHEACLNLLGDGIGSAEGKQLAIDTLKYMRSILKEFQSETGNLYNLEATPAESTSYRFARLDQKYHPDIKLSGDEEPFLTNSTQLNVDKTDDVVMALEHQNDIQTLYTGGTIFHTFLGERMTTGASCKRLVQKIAYNTKLPYFSITPTFSICKNHGYIRGEHFKCKECGEATEVYSRIVGYYRPISNWNKGKAEEFVHRKEFDEKISLSSPMKGELFAYMSDGNKDSKSDIPEEKQESVPKKAET